MDKPVTDFINGPVIYDAAGTMLLIQRDEGVQVLADVRGWGSIANMFTSPVEASDYQDKIGQFIADAINDKLTITKGK